MKVVREILANVSFEETRVAIIEDGRIVEILWERQADRNIVGNIYKGVVENVLPGISSAFVNIGFEKNAYLYVSDVLPPEGRTSRGPIDECLKKGQSILVQVAKEAISTKGMKVTMDIALPGRYMVFTPFQEHRGISKQIDDKAERDRLTAAIEHLSAKYFKGKGAVVRTEAEGASDSELEEEARYLARLWEDIQRKAQAARAPALIHRELDLVLQVARDYLNDEVKIFLIDDRQAHQEALEFVSRLCPGLKNRVRLYEAKTPIFTAFNVEEEIENMRKSKLPLPSGGTIIIQEAESLCAIDVNTGRFTGSRSQEETATATNIEAAIECAHQLRLRNIGGIIVIDFIDMKKASNRQKVGETLQQAMKRDRAKVRILPITRLGLVEMTRERKRESTMSLLTEECPQCQASGRVLSAESMRIKIQREIHDLTQGRPGGSIRICLHPRLAETFRQQQQRIEKNVHRAIQIQPDAELQWEEYRIILE